MMIFLNLLDIDCVQPYLPNGWDYITYHLKDWRILSAFMMIFLNLLDIDWIVYNPISL
jgi:hypothetical protein